MSQGTPSTPRNKSAFSGASRASISVKLPSTNVDQDLERDSPVHVRSLSPSRNNTNFTAASSRHGSSAVGKTNSAAVRNYSPHSSGTVPPVGTPTRPLLTDKEFAGTEFPPMIFFKVYTCNTNGLGVKYVSGKKMIQPASEAARDACDLMGHRRFYELLLQDMLRHEAHGVSDEVDVTTLKDYMQYLSLLDETPGYMGGRDNGWRKLTLEVLPRHTVFYDVIGYLHNRKMTPQLRADLPALLVQPTTEELQLEHIRILAKIRTPEAPLPTPKAARPNPQEPSRRSRQAKVRANKMKKVYGQHHAVNVSGVTQETDPTGAPYAAPGADGKGGESGDEEWEEEADKLYQWTQQLSLDEIVGTPRLGTAVTTGTARQMGSVLY